MFKNKYSIKSLLIRSIVIIIGIAIAAISAPFLIYSTLGCDPFTAFNQGASDTFGITFGQAVLALNGLFAIYVLIFDRSYIHVGTILNLVLLGPLSDLFLNIFAFLGKMNLSLPAQIGLLALGIFCVGFGLGLYQAAELGIGPADAFNQITATKLKVNLRTERICYDALLVVGAFFLHGPIWIGTIAGIILIGPIMAPTFKYGSKLINKITDTNTNAA